jgi:hypothetical protein
MSEGIICDGYNSIVLVILLTMNDDNDEYAFVLLALVKTLDALIVM